MTNNIANGHKYLDVENNIMYNDMSNIYVTHNNIHVCKEIQHTCWRARQVAHLCIIMMLVYRIGIWFGRHQNDRHERNKNEVHELITEREAIELKTGGDERIQTHTYSSFARERST